MIIRALFRWLERRRAIRRQWQADARRLIDDDEPGAYYFAQRSAARSRIAGDRAGFWHWAKVASEIARRSAIAEMDRAVVQRIVDEESAPNTPPMPSVKSTASPRISRVSKPVHSRNQEDFGGL